MSLLTRRLRRHARRPYLLAVLSLLAASLIVGTAGIAVGAEEAEDRPQPPSREELRIFDSQSRDDLRAGPRAARRAPSTLPQGGRKIFPRYRLVSLYGAPQLGRTILGRKSVEGARKKLNRQSRVYRRLSRRPVVKGFDLIATIATADAGADGRYRFRQSDALIRTYLRAARSINARLMLDIQPGRSSFLTEAQAFAKWLRKPDVDLALDPEWNVGPTGVPGRSAGGVGARQVNKVSRYLAGLVRQRGLPQKALVIHQFTERMVRDRQTIRQRGGSVAVTLNFDGIGSPSAKRAGYKALSERGLFDGFSLFYQLDSPLMKPERVVGLSPRARFVMYQ